MKNATDVAKAIAARRGLTPEDLQRLTGGEPVLDPRGWVHDNPVAHRLESQRELFRHAFEGTFADAQPDHPAMAHWVEQYRAGGIGGGPAKPWLTLRGLQGRGKTHQAYGGVRVLAESAARANQSFRWRIFTHPELNRKLRPQPDDSHVGLIDFLADQDLIVWDDFCAGSFKDYAIEGTLDLLDALYRRNKMLIVTTNLNWADIDAILGARVTSRLREGTVVVLDGEDRRLSMGAKL